MKCYKCGYEFDNSSACPACGASAIIVNQDYLKRKAEYEKEGKVSVFGIQVESGEKDTEDNATPYDKLDAMIKGLKDKHKSAKKTKAKKRHLSFTKRDIVFFTVFVLAVAILVYVSIMFVKNLRREVVCCIGTTTEQKKADNLVQLVETQSKTYLVDGKKIYDIVDTPLTTKITSGKLEYIVYEHEAGVYIFTRKNGKSTKLCDNSKLLDALYSPNLEYALLMIQDVKTESNSVMLIKTSDMSYVTGSTADELLGIDNDGRAYYLDIDYSPINAVNSMTVCTLSESGETVLSNSAKKVAYDEDQALYYLENNTLYSCKAGDTTVIATEVESLYAKKRGNCVYYRAQDGIYVISDGKVHKTCDCSDMIDYVYYDKDICCYVCGDNMYLNGAAAVKLSSDVYYDESSSSVIYIDEDHNLIKKGKKSEKIASQVTADSLIYAGGKALYKRDDSLYIGHDKICEGTAVSFVPGYRSDYISLSDGRLVVYKKGKVETYDNITFLK